MKRLEWAWTLPHGEVIEARLELPGKSETVFLDGKVVSQTDGPKADGHIVPLAGEGAYRGAREVKVVFDTVGDSVANAVLTIDGGIIRPRRSPRARRSLLIPLIGGVVALGVGTFVARTLLAPAPVKAPSGEGPAAMIMAGPAESTSGSPLPTDADSIISELNWKFRLCWHEAPLTDKVGGYIVMLVDISEEGAVTSSSVLVNGPGAAVSSCVSDAVKAARFARMPEKSSLKFRIAFVVARVSPW